MSALGASVAGPAGNEAVTFRVWAPRCRSVEVAVDGRRPAPLKPGDAGVWEVTLDRVAPGTRYRYRLDGERHRPDPASRWQPEGIHGPSAVVDPTRFVWTDDAFAGHALADLVIYELHVGTFTRAGTFEAIISHLASLSELGVTALELMPVAEFPGSRNWGYDGVHLFAPQSTYGGPRGLRRLVDACHAQGLSVFLDLVYNHLGPEGNYLAEFAPYFTDRHRTPWGPAVDFDGPEAGGVRRHVVENACAWVQEYHLDGLRLDAVHALHDTSPRHILQEIAEAVHAEGERRGRPVHVIAESHDNDRRLVTPVAAGGHGLDAVWSDDFHHALHRRLTGERAGYYADFGEEGHLPRALAEGFAYQGERSTFWGRPRGTPSADLEAERFVVSVQNHDQVGNRPQGERLSSLVGPAAARLAAGLLLAAPAVPLLFMGEEYGETAPFQFFTSFLDRDLAEAARAGRVADCRHFGWDGPVPDPTDPAAFVRSRLNHPLAAAPRHRALREYYAAWLTLRRSHAALGARGKLLARAGLEEGGAVLVLTRRAASGEEVRVVANLTGAARPWAGAREPGWRALLDSEDVRFGGSRPRVPLAPYQLLVQERAR